MKRLRKAAVVLVVFALGIVVEARVRRTPSDSYGRLFGQQVAVRNDDLKPRKIEVVAEAPVQPSASATVLTASSATEQPAGTTVAAPEATTRPSRSRFAIVGDANGVSVVNNGRHLAGGFGR